MEPKEIPSRLIFRLLVVSTWQLEILVTTLFWVFAYKRFDCSSCSTRDGKGSVTDLGEGHKTPYILDPSQPYRANKIVIQSEPHLISQGLVPPPVVPRRCVTRKCLILCESFQAIIH